MVCDSLYFNADIGNSVEYTIWVGMYKTCVKAPTFNWKFYLSMCLTKIIGKFSIRFHIHPTNVMDEDIQLERFIHFART
jgi:hypothetical protein